MTPMVESFEGLIVDRIVLFPWNGANGQPSGGTYKAERFKSPLLNRAGQTKSTTKQRSRYSPMMSFWRYLISTGCMP